MPARYNLNFKILFNRYPVLKAGSTSRLAKLMGIIRTEMQTFITSVNDVYDALFIQNVSGDILDKYGVTLDLPRNGGEHDDDYRARLLTELRDIPEGLTISALKTAVDQVMGGSCVVDEYYSGQWQWPIEGESPVYQQFGLESIGASYAVAATDQIVACKFNLSSDETVNLRKITAYLEAESAGQRVAHCAIYQDNAGAPGAKIVDADYTVTFDEAKWHEFEFKETELAPNNDYWLAICVTGGSWRYYYDAGVTNQLATAADAPPPDDPFPTPSYLNRAMSIYASHHIYNWERILDNPEDKFKVAAIVTAEPNSSELDQIEENINQVKRADIVVRVVQERPEFFQLYREIL